MKKHNGYMIPKTRSRVQSKYICTECKKELSPAEAYFYVDSCNYAITENAKPYCRECYRERYGE